jgi:hypothetical protein
MIDVYIRVMLFRMIWVMGQSSLNLVVSL